MADETPVPHFNPRMPEGVAEMPVEKRRNLIDFYQSMQDDHIKGDLDKSRHQFAVLCENFAGDFNVATNVRNNNAFLGSEIWITGNKRWDKRGTVGTHKYEHVKLAPDSVSVIKDFKARGYSIVVADNVEGAIDLREYKWNPKSLIVLGQEQIGVSNEALALADSVVYIAQFGSVRSLNVGVAGGILMYDIATKLKLAPPERELL